MKSQTLQILQILLSARSWSVAAVHISKHSCVCVVCAMCVQCVCAVVVMCACSVVCVCFVRCGVCAESVYGMCVLCFGVC